MTLNMKKNGTMNSNIQQTDKTQTLLPDLLFHDLGKGVLAFSTCRGGGVGIGPYSSFNINAYCGDSEEHIKRNRSLLLNFLKLASEHLIMPHQTHGVTVAAIDAAYFEYNDEQRKACLEGVDALITNLRGVCIGVSTADCIPILCYDATCGIVAAIHAGWRSTVGRIVRSTIAQMQSIFGSQPANIRAVICPGISVDAFEVGDEVYENFAHHGFPMEQLAVRYPAKDGSGEKWHIDLWEANRLQLLESGVPSGQISCSGICTYTHSDKFFSARKLGIASGRIFNGILLSP